MSTRYAAPLALTSTALLLSACSTVQENPNYQYSSKYGVTETVQTAQVEPVTEPAVEVVTASHPGEAVSPTGQAYDAENMVGTPGYEVLMAQEAEVPAYAAPTPSPLPVPGPTYSQPREVAYDYAQNAIVAEGSGLTAQTTQSLPNRSAPTPAGVPTGQTYIVRPGDTVYSLSRRLCAPLPEIMSANGIGPDFSISIGQTLVLPTSRC